MKPTHVQIAKKQNTSKHNKEMFQKSVTLLVAFLAWCSLASAQHWIAAPTFPGSGAGTAILRTDGAVMVEEVTGPASTGGNATGNWYLLDPDDKGSYATGVWGLLTPTTGLGYAPMYFGSAVLPDSRIVIEG